MTTKKQPTSGFTIIELLIVIVVIGILAALILTAYSNIQDRAQVSVTRNTIQQFSKAFVAFKVDNGRYPGVLDIDSVELDGVDGGMGACIGAGYKEDLPCGPSVSPGTIFPSFNKELEEYTGKTPNISPHTVPIVIDPVAGTPITFTGISYVPYDTDGINGIGGTIDGQPSSGGIFMYALDEVNASCTGGAALRFTNEFGVFTSKDNNGNVYQNSLTDDTSTGCIVMLP